MEQERVATLERELWKQQKANEAFQKAFREIGEIVTAVIKGDLSKKVQIYSAEMDPEIERLAQGEIIQLQQTINTMVDKLRMFADQITGATDDMEPGGMLGGQDELDGMKGVWNTLIVDINAMAENFIMLVRDMAMVTTAVATGDLTQRVRVGCKGESKALKEIINYMVDQLQQFAEEITMIAKKPSTERRLGQITMHHVQGTWKDLTENVNSMAINLERLDNFYSTVPPSPTKDRRFDSQVEELIRENDALREALRESLGDDAISISKFHNSISTNENSQELRKRFAELLQPKHTKLI
ncbi:hypothetical protein B7463_g10840, partial [Scytalidium lignicola]